MRDLTAEESAFLNTDSGGSGLTCIFCRGSEFLEGPSGGASVNVQCASCGARYNITPGVPGFNEQLIGGREDDEPTLVVGPQPEGG